MWVPTTPVWQVIDMRRSAALGAVLVATLAAGAGCNGNPSRSDNGRPVDPDDTGIFTTSLPERDVTVLDSDHAGGLAVQASQALFDRSTLVVLAGAGDPPGQREAAAEAVRLRVPLLLTPAPEAGDVREAGRADAGEAAGTGGELDRLGTDAVLTYGEAADAWARTWAREHDRPVDTVAAPGEPPHLPDAHQPLTSLTVLTTGADRAVAATATARAAGAQVLVTDVTDPRVDRDVIAALAADPPTHTLAVGAEFGPADRLRGRLATATTGTELPGGGQVVFPHRRLVALYGHPGDPVLGVLGEQPRDAAIARARKLAARYEPLVDEPVVPALEIITTIASAGRGSRGDYSRRTPVGDLRGWVAAAAEAGVYVVLDLQPGRTDFLTQAKEYEELLVEPHVGLALDPEWRLGPGQRHLVDIGSVGAAEVNDVVTWLADLTAAHRLPQKLLILHQFQLRMIANRNKVDTGRDEVAVLIHADGFGTRGQKLATYRALNADSPPRVWWGWKNFYDEDQPTFTPKQTVELDPSPRFVSYQ